MQVEIESNCIMERAKEKKTGNQVGPEPEKDLDIQERDLMHISGT